LLSKAVTKPLCSFHDRSGKTKKEKEKSTGRVPLSREIIRRPLGLTRKIIKMLDSVFGFSIVLPATVA
jgi:hypothetical protein